MIVNLRKTHKALYRSAMACALLSIGLGLNFLFFKPPFNPYSIDYRAVGAVFLALGSFKLFCLVYLKNLKLIRLSMAACIAFMLWWGVGTSFTFFTGQTSLQLPFLYIFVVTSHIIWLLEPYVNPVTNSSNGSA